MAGDKRPLKISGLRVGKTIVSLMTAFTSSRPLISSNLTLGDESKIVSSIYFNNSGSKLDFLCISFFSSLFYKLLFTLFA